MRKVYADSQGTDVGVDGWLQNSTSDRLSWRSHIAHVCPEGWPCTSFSPFVLSATHGFEKGGHTKCRHFVGRSFNFQPKILQYFFVFS